MGEDVPEGQSEWRTYRGRGMGKQVPRCSWDLLRFAHGLNQLDSSTTTKRMVP